MHEGVHWSARFGPLSDPARRPRRVLCALSHSALVTARLATRTAGHISASAAVNRSAREIAAHMDGPCCKGVVRDASALTGEAVTIGGAPAYLALPKAGEGKPVGVMVIHDIWGFNIPNAKYVADHLAAAAASAGPPCCGHLAAAARLGQTSVGHAGPSAITRAVACRPLHIPTALWISSHSSPAVARRAGEECEEIHKAVGM